MTNVPENSAIPDQVLYTQVSWLIRKGFWRLKFNEHLESAFRRYYKDETLANLRLISRYIVPGYFLVVAALFIQVPVDEMGFYPHVIAIITLALLAGVVILRLGILEDLIFFGLGLMATLTTALVLIAVPSVKTELMQSMAIVGSALLYTMIYVLSRLRFWQATFWCMLSGPLAYAATLLLQYFGLLGDYQIKHYLYNSCYLAPNITGMILCYLVEHRERMVFLQDKQIFLEKKRLADLTQQLDALSKTDSLTNIGNRRYFDEMLDTEWKRAARSRHPLGMLLIDVDHFKAYNDHYGHPAGDKVLMEVANAMRTSAQRPTDMVCRFGGEEFVILLPNTDIEGCQIVAQRLHERLTLLALPHEKSGSGKRVTVSIGIICEFGDGRLEDFIKRADEALYNAKAQGRNQSCLSRMSDARSPGQKLQ